MNSEGEESLVAVARAVRTRGLKGELVADLLTDFPERFAKLSRLICIPREGARQEVELAGHWFQGHRIVLKLAGIDDPESARQFVGCEFAIPESERVPLSEGEFYEWELHECTVKTIEGKNVGTVQGVLRTGGVDTLIVENEAKHEYLVPLAESIVIKIDIANKAITIDPPQGLLEV